jgi:hypothetical protein
MHPYEALLQRSRRRFMTDSLHGAGTVALAGLLAGDGLALAPSHAAEAQSLELRSPEARDSGERDDSPLAPRPPHFAAKAKNCIYIYLEGGPSQMDLFDPKPKLNELNGSSLPKEMLDKARFAFIKPDTATLLGSPRKWKKYGQCGMDFSDLLPHLGSCADDLLMVRSLHSEEFNHHPGQLLMQCGVSRFGMPSMGSWINYGLGSASQNLPGYVVLTAGRGGSGGSSLWQSGFLSTKYSGVLFRNQGEPVLNLQNPAGLPPEIQRAGLDALGDGAEPDALPGGPRS